MSINASSRSVARHADTLFSIRSNDGRCANIVLGANTSIETFRDRIALELGVPLSSAQTLALSINNAAARSSISSDIVNVHDLAIRFMRGPTNKISLVVDNCNVLSPKVAFELCQILKHWTSPALTGKTPYQLAVAFLRDIIEEIRESPESRHSLDAVRVHRVFRRVARGLELIKKMGFTVTPSAVYAPAGVDPRVFEVAADRLSMPSIPIETPLARRASLSRRSAMPGLPSRFTSLLPNANVADRTRRLRQLIDMSYEALLRLENVQVGLPAETLKVMPIQVIDETCLAGIRRSGQDACSICLEEYNVGDSIMRLPCLHCFHEACANQWFTGSKRCPSDMVEITLDSNHQDCAELAQDY